MPEPPRGVMFQVPVHLTARTPEDLTIAMLRNNIKDGIRYSYFDIQKNGKDWFCWYLKDIGKIVKNQLDEEIIDGGRPQLPSKDA